ncbi:hypothetical protein M405DRAFT_831809 [Rhizopogon salebrosus TDB-379]|nr:hypothetical protein M405DRAFT_831809 [Rhizopogon salebrosus TDB-379]
MRPLPQLLGSLIASLIDCHLPSDTADLSCTLLRRVLTALIHHCNSSEQFSVVASLVIDRFCILSQAEDVNFSVPCKSRLWSVLFAKGLDYIILHFASALLIVGDIAMSAGPAGAFVIRALSVASLGLMLCGVLAELSWSGWKLIGLPFSQRLVPSWNPNHPSPCVFSRIYKMPESWARLTSYFQNCSNRREHA